MFLVVFSLTSNNTLAAPGHAALLLPPRGTCLRLASFRFVVKNRCRLACLSCQLCEVLYSFYCSHWPKINIFFYVESCDLLSVVNTVANHLCFPDLLLFVMKLPIDGDVLYTTVHLSFSTPQYWYSTGPVSELHESSLSEPRYTTVNDGWLTTSRQAS